MIENISVHKARMRMGVTLGEKILRERPDHDIDVVIPIPDTSRDSAMELANVLGVKYREGFVKNRYVGRTFIMPGQGERAKSVKRKLRSEEHTSELQSLMRSEYAGFCLKQKNVC